ncbi:MAG: hypothetical protein VB125_01425 [Burkholderia sp.]
MKTYKHLSCEERTLIHLSLEQGCKLRGPCTGSGCLDTILRSGGKWQERCLTGFER